MSIFALGGAARMGSIVYLTNPLFIYLSIDYLFICHLLSVALIT